MKLSLRNMNAYTIFALILLIGGLVFYILWGLRYSIWMDVGVYSLTIILVLVGLFGMILSLMIEKPEEQ